MLTPTMGVEWSSWKITRSPFGRKNCVYLMGGRTGAPGAVGVDAAFAPPFDLAFCANVLVAAGGERTSAASATSARRFQNIFTPPRVLRANGARVRGPFSCHTPAPCTAL